jgi:hypothetical protein
MLSKQDDFLGHQLPTTFDHVMSSDPAWMERLWYTGHPVPGGDLIFDIGLGWHPNRNVMDGFAGVAMEGRQHNFRVSRRLRPDPLESAIGPLQIEVIEGLRRHRLTLRPNESGLCFDLEFVATMNPHEECEHFRRRNGRVTEHMARAQQLGAYRGWLEVEGRRIEVEEGSWLGQRDHSWGIRAEMRTDESSPPLTHYPPFFYCWTTAQFKNRGLHVFFKERAPGDKIYISGEEVGPIGVRSKNSVRLEDVSHEVVWAEDPLGQTLGNAELQARFSDGSARKLKIRALPGRYFLKGGLYGGLSGWFHGDDKGRLYTEHEVWPLADPAIRKLVRTLSDHVIEVTDGDDVGYGIVEYGVGKGFAKYEEVQDHPPI